MSLSVSNLHLDSVYIDGVLDMENFIKVDQITNNNIPVNIYDSNLKTLQLNPANQVDTITGSSETLEIDDNVTKIIGGTHIGNLPRSKSILKFSQ